MRGAVLLIGASLVLRVLILRDSYFVEDDLLFVGNAYESDLSLDFVTRIHKGHFMPGALALTWVLSRIAPYDWLLVATVTFLAQALLGVLALRLLRLLFGTRPAILLPLAVLLFSPLTIPPFGWWASALNAIPLQLAMVLALTAQIRFARGEGSRYGRHAMAWSVTGMAFSTKGVFVVFLLFAVTTAFLGDREAGWVRSMIGELGRNRRLWGAYLALMAAYTALYLARRDTAPGEGAVVPKPDVAVDLVGLMLGRTFPTGAVGGPLTWSPVTPTGGMSGPSDVMVAVSWLVLAVLVAATVAYRRRALRAWSILAAYLVFADAVPTVIARGSFTAMIGAETRYVADAVVVLAVVLGLALMPLRGEADPYRRPLPPRSSLVLTAGLAAGAYLAASLASIEAYRATLSGDRVRAYLNTVAAELARVPDDAVIYPTPVPEDIVLAVNGDRRLSTRLLAPLARPGTRIRMAHPEPSHEARVFNEDGRLVRMSVFGFFQPAPQGERCIPSVNGVVTLPGVAASGGKRDGAGALSYTAGRAVSATVEIGAERIMLNLRETQSGLVHFPVRGTGPDLRIVIDDPAAQVCLTGVALGVAAPEGWRPS
ncbi:hypothetical protein [Planomonospora venezuelensis]|uniref:Transmembrane protein n=1 Tax=Planomonospora venezuelensis TaxID=1999 RepID=A0A841CYZ7_PLAVE|nr:hypothetical protein [Planomonospora venezuelensis]MBB5962023.1 hypothetical protein [Planomonospora venezuelensis]